MSYALFWTLVVMLLVVAFALFGLILRLIKVLRNEAGVPPTNQSRPGKRRGARGS